MPKFNPTFTAQELQNERWKPVVGFEGLYEVSNLGRVRTLRPSPRLPVGGHISSQLDRLGYVRASISGLTERKVALVHQLVAAAFIGPCPSGLQVNHKDGVKTNNRPENLEYVTAKENRIHASRMGLLAFGDRNGSRKHPERLRRGENHPTHLHPERVVRGERSGMAKITAKDVVEIRRRFAQGGITREKLGAMYGISKHNVFDIVHRKSWKHVP